MKLAPDPGPRSVDSRHDHLFVLATRIEELRVSEELDIREQGAFPTDAAGTTLVERAGSTPAPVRPSRYWYPVHAHPAAGGAPWFTVDHEGFVRRFHGHPMDASTVPSFHTVGTAVYTTGADETKFCGAGVEWFSIRGSMISRGNGHPDGPSRVALYQQRDDYVSPGSRPDRDEAPMSREENLLLACVECADTFTDDYDVVASARRIVSCCSSLLDTAEASIMLADRDGALSHIASSSEPLRQVELYEVQHACGPDLDAYRMGTSAHFRMTDSGDDQWSDFAAHAREAGFESASVVVMRLRDNTIGTLGLYSYSPDDLSPSDVLVAQALANIATIGILQQRALSDARVVESQLENALQSRVVIEQAKGMLSERVHVSVEVAFSLLRGYARDHRRPLRETARDVVSGNLSAAAITLTAAQKRHTTITAATAAPAD